MPWGLAEFNQEPALTERGTGGGRKGVWGTQWEQCQRCGLVTPTGEMVFQKGLRICTRKGCFDNLQVERRDREIIDALSSTAAEAEGMDTREIESQLFDTFEDL